MIDTNFDTGISSDESLGVMSVTFQSGSDIMNNYTVIRSLCANHSIVGVIKYYDK